VQGERDYYSVKEAAEALGTTPARVLEMMAAGELEGLPPGATAEGVWKVLLPVASKEEPAPDQVPHLGEREEEVESPPEPPKKAADVEDQQPQAASTGETAGEMSDENIGEPDEVTRKDAGRFGWTTTKQAAKVLGVSRRSVQGYVHRGLLEAREEGGGVNKRFLISIDSLNALLDRRRRDADDAAKFSGASAEAEQTANLYANAGEALRHAIERVEARTAEATELRIRLQITEQAESTLRAELEEERRRRVAAERARDRLRRALEGMRATPSEPSESSETAANEQQGRGPIPDAGGPQEPAQPRSWWRRMFGG
jgi:Helix-turn-helix domain